MYVNLDIQENHFVWKMSLSCIKCLVWLILEYWISLKKTCCKFGGDQFLWIVKDTHNAIFKILIKLKWSNKFKKKNYKKKHHANWMRKNHWVWSFLEFLSQNCVQHFWIVFLVFQHFSYIQHGCKKSEGFFAPKNKHRIKYKLYRESHVYRKGCNPASYVIRLRELYARMHLVNYKKSQKLQQQKSGYTYNW